MKKTYFKPEIEFIDFNLHDLVMNNMPDFSMDVGDDEGEDY